jgi:hypothetical protein
MIETCKSALEHFVAEYVYIVDEKKLFSIEEKKQGGAGKAFFRSDKPSLVLKAKDQAPMVWAFSNRQCAEGAFVTFDDDGCRLHILEMKSKLTQAEWAKVTRQLSGMYLTALAACRILGVTEFKSVVCYVAFKEDAMSPSKSADSIFMKTFVGRRNSVGGSDAWSTGVIKLPFDTSALIQKGQRDVHHNVDFGLV